MRFVNRAISQGYRGKDSKIVTGGDLPYDADDSECVFCGQCIQVCPVGALTEKMQGAGTNLGTQTSPHNVPLLWRRLSADTSSEG